MSDKQPSDKGKARANESAKSESADGHTRAGSETTSSLSSKVLSSATGLARDLMGAGNGALASSLSESAASTGKTRPVATGGSSHAPASSALETLGCSSSMTGGAQASRQNESFRTSEVNNGTAEAFEDFQQDNSNKSMEQAIAAQQLHSNADPWIAEFMSGPSHVDEYSQDDGLEVAQLLSDPYFVAMTDEAEPEPAQSAEDAADLFAEDFSVEEQQAAKVIKDDLPAPPIHQPIAADNPRNLVANFEALLAGNENGMNSATYATSNMVHFHTKEDQQQWYSQWSGVLNQYTDEVWGDMLPIVREEKKHAEAIKEGKENVDSKSVQRLNMILGHVEQYRHWRG